ncbi:ankyrin repeat protein [Apiospora sp. TS-2023a]
MSYQAPSQVDIPDDSETLTKSPKTTRSLESPRFGLEWSETFCPVARYDVILIHGLKDAIGDVWNTDGQNWVENVLFSEKYFSVAEFRYDTSCDDAPIYAINGIEKEATNLLDGLTQDHIEEGGSPRTCPLLTEVSSLLPETLVDSLPRRHFVLPAVRPIHTGIYCVALVCCIATREFPDHKLPQSKVLDWLTLLPECPPVRYPAVIKLPAIPFHRWSESHKQFDDWLKHYDEGLQMVHLHSVSGASELSEQVLQHVQSRQSWAKVLYFRFYPNDSRLNSTRAMMLYILTQHMRWTNRTCVWPIEALPHALTIRDLYQCFVDLVWTRNKKKGVWLIIAGIQHADMDLFWFLQQLNEVGSRLEVPSQVVVTSDGNQRVISQLTEFTTINLSASPITEQLKHDVLMAKTLASRRKLEDMSTSCSEVVLAVPRIFEAHFSDPQLADMVLQWTIKTVTLRSFSFDLCETLNHILNTAPKDIFRTTLDSLPVDQRKLARDVSVLVMTAFRPLTVDEIASALLFRLGNLSPTDPPSYCASTDKGHRRLVEQIHQIIPVLFTIRHGEVHFAHDSIMESQGCDMFPLASSRHATMTLICLEYLRLPTTWTMVADLVHERTADNIPVSESRRDFLAYAANHVVGHYSLCEKTVPLIEMLAFFKMAHARAAWLDALDTFSGSMSRKSYGSNVSTFQCVAQTGIVDLVTAMVSEQRQSPNFETECVLAISEAALYGHAECVRLLLQEMGSVVSALKDSISAAASSGNENTLSLLIDFCSRSETFVWPEGLLCRVAWLGFSGIVKKLLEIGLSLDWKIDYESSLFLREHTQISIDNLSPRKQLLVAPLATALVAGHGPVVKVILEADKTELPPEISQLLLKQAVASADPDTVRLMFKHSARRMGSAEKDAVLQVATESSSYRAVEALFQPGPNLSLMWHAEIFPESYAVGPLITAIERGYTKCVKLLILHTGMKINVPHNGKTALHEAVKSKRLKVARMLLGARADPNFMVDNQHPLITAVDNEDQRMVEILLINGANIEAHIEHDGTKGETALAVAAGKEDTTMLHTLLQRGARVNHGNPDLLSPLYVAAFEGHLETVKILLECRAQADDGDLLGPWDPTPLNVAFPHAAIVTELLDHGADINYRTSYGTVLYQASKGPDLELDNEALVRGYSDENMTPLCVACKHGHPEIVQALLEAGANARHKARSSGAMTPLHFCVGFIDHKGPDPQLPLFTLLSFNSRLDVNEVDSFGRTALHLIDADTPVSFVAALVNAGASTEVLDTRGTTPLAKAIKSGNVEVFEYLKTKDQNKSDGRNAICPLRLACAAGNAAMVEHLVYSGADVDEVDRSTGETPLYALFTGPGASSDLVRFLVDEWGADVNKPGGEFKYPLIKAFTCYIDKHWTSEDRRRLVLKIYSNIRLLLRRGADIDAEDDAGRRAVHLALSSLSPTVPWHLFEEFGADLSARDNLGRSALHYAAALGLPSDLDWLAERTTGADINVVDSHGWTPLFWATQQRRPANFNPMVEVLKQHGADLWAKTTDSYGVWTPLKLARFRGCFTEGSLLTLIPKEKTRKRAKRLTGGDSDVAGRHHDTKDEESAPADEEIETWNDEQHETETGYLWGRDVICQSCFMECRGIMYKCTQKPGVLVLTPIGMSIISANIAKPTEGSWTGLTTMMFGTSDLGDDYDDSDEETEDGWEDED